MRERPILMSAPMVRAILSGAKSQTRRTMKPQPPLGWFTDEAELLDAEAMKWLLAKCPYGAVGDQLWVKEGIRKEEPADLYHDDGTPIVYSQYAADNAWTKASAWPWKRNTLPSMFMPRGLSRITLEVTGVRVERLHDITEADACAEGIVEPAKGWPEGFGGWNFNGEDVRGRPFSHAFFQLWCDINGRDSWSENPWVWVVEFKPTPTDDKTRAE